METPTPSVQLRAWRTARGLSQAAAGALIGVTGPAWCDWESGKRTPSDFRAALEILTGIPASAWASEVERDAIVKATAAAAVSAEAP